MDVILVLIILILAIALWTVIQVSKIQKIYTDYWYNEYKQMQKEYFKALRKEQLEIRIFAKPKNMQLNKNPVKTPLKPRENYAKR